MAITVVFRRMRLCRPFLLKTSPRLYKTFILYNYSNQKTERKVGKIGSSLCSFYIFVFPILRSFNHQGGFFSMFSAGSSMLSWSPST